MVEKIQALKDADTAAARAAEENGQKQELTPEQQLENIGTMLKKVRKIQKNRTHEERQWLTSLAFLFGKQHFAISKKAGDGVQDRIMWEIKNLERSKKTQVTVNRILPLYRSLLARVLATKTKVFVEPETRTSRDTDSAKVAEELLEDFWQNANKSNQALSVEYTGMQQVISRAVAYALSMCQGTLKPYYNDKAKVKTVLDGKIEELPAGAVEIKVLHNFNFVRDPLRRWASHWDIMSVDSIEEQWGKRIEPETVQVDEYEQQLMALMDGTAEENYDDAAKVFQYYELPCPKYPNGLYKVFTESVMILSGDLPPEHKGALPFFTCDFLDLPMLRYPQSMVEQLIPLQEDYNFTVKRIRDYKKWMTGKVIIEDGAKIQTKWDDEVGQIIKKAPGAKADYLQAPSMPQELFSDLARIVKDMEDIAARHDVSMARAPKGVKSGVAIDSLAEADDSQLAPEMIGFETQLSYCAEHILGIMEMKYQEPRLASIAGSNYGPEVKTFKGQDAVGNRRIKVSMGSSMPVGRAARQQYIFMLKKEGLISPEKTVELLEMEDTDGMFFDIDRDAEKSEIQDMMNGIPTEPKPWENHTIRLKVLADFMMSDEFKKMVATEEPPVEGKPSSQEIAHYIYEHYVATQQMLLQEQEVQAGSEAGSSDKGQPENNAPKQ